MKEGTVRGLLQEVVHAVVRVLHLKEEAAARVLHLEEEEELKEKCRVTVAFFLLNDPLLIFLMNRDFMLKKQEKKGSLFQCYRAKARIAGRALREMVRVPWRQG